MSLWCFGVEQLCVWRQATGANLQIFEKGSASLVSFIRRIATKKKQTLAKFLGSEPLFGKPRRLALARRRHQQKCRCADDVAQPPNP